MKKKAIITKPVAELFVGIPAVKTLLESCSICRYACLHRSFDGTIGKRLVTVRLLPCRRFPAEVVVEEGGWCGEFKRKE